MLKEQLSGLTLALIDEVTVETFSFTGDHVAATLGTLNGAICAPLLELRINSPASLTIHGQGFEIVWENIICSGQQLSVIRNGRPAIYRVEKRSDRRPQTRRLP